MAMKYIMVLMIENRRIMRWRVVLRNNLYERYLCVIFSENANKSFRNRYWRNKVFPENMHMHQGMKKNIKILITSKKKNSLVKKNI